MIISIRKDTHIFAHRMGYSWHIVRLNDLIHTVCGTRITAEQADQKQNDGNVCLECLKHRSLYTEENWDGKNPLPDTIREDVITEAIRRLVDEQRTTLDHLTTAECQVFDKRLRAAYPNDNRFILRKAVR